MKKATIRTLAKQLKAALAERDRKHELYVSERADRVKVENAEKETREHFADLKKRLYESETENARLRGYMERVHEDDIVHDGFVEIEDADGKRMVPKRRPPMMTVRNGEFMDHLQYGSEKKRTHWTSY